jgi:signal transduction histidine kinase
MFHNLVQCVVKFPDSSLLFVQVAKKILAFGFALLIAYPFYLISPNPVIIPIAFGIGLFAYLKLMEIFDSNFFLNLEAKRFLQTINEFKLRSRKIIYTSPQEYQDDIDHTFCEKLNIKSSDIVLIDEENRHQYRHLIEFFQKNITVVTAREIRIKKLQREVKKLGQVIMPLFHPSKEVIGFLTLGEKNSGKSYSQEEIKALEEIQPNLSLKLTVALFSARLIKQVSHKIEILKKQNKKINELLAQQADFISVSAHELRTPLSIALLQTELLTKSLPKNEEIQSTQVALTRLQRLVQKLFSVQHYDLEKASLRLREINFTDFVAKLFRNFETLAEKKSIKLILKNKLAKDFKIKIDPLQVQQVFQNLMSNALKFTPKKGQIILQIKKSKKELQFCILDSGCGISKKMHKSIFEKFRSVQASNGQGIGLGLYLCKKIVELHHGKIWTEVAEAGGAKFCVSLPC